MSYETYRRSLTPVVRALYRLEIRGLEHVPEDGPLVVVGNHESILDPFIVSAAISRPIRYLAKSELWSVPLLPWWLASVEAIPVERGEERRRRDSLGDRSARGRARSSASFPRAASCVKARGSAARPGWRSRPARRSCPFGCSRRARRSGVAGFGFPRLAVLIGEPIAVPRTTPTPELARELTDEVQATVEALGT